MGRLYDATMGRGFAAWYGAVMRRIDASGLSDVRRDVLSEARGSVLDLGSGTGANLPHFPPGLDRVVLSEPSAYMLRTLRAKVGGKVELVQAPAERLPFDDATFDSVTCGLVLCTVPDPRAGLAEVARVLKPGGSFLFVEHVRSSDPRVARFQDRVERPWRFVADGCHCNRDSLAAIEASLLEVRAVGKGEMPRAPFFMRPLVFGAAVLASD